MFVVCFVVVVVVAVVVVVNGQVLREKSGKGAKEWLFKRDD